MIVRILLLLALVYLIWRLVRLARSRLSAVNRATAKRSGLRVSSVRCAQCGLFLPESDALLYKGRHYCSTEHRDEMEE